MKNIFSISLIFLLIVSTTGIHLGFAHCSMNNNSQACSITENTSCCGDAVSDKCCTTSQIEQDGTFYDFVVTQAFKIAAPIALLSNLEYFNFIDLFENKNPIPVTTPPPIFINHQTVFQVFLC